MMCRRDGYILLEVLIAVQVIVLMVLFVASVTMYHRSVILENQQRQSAMYTLQTELERFISEKTLDGLGNDGSGGSPSTPAEERSFNVVDDLGNTYDIQLCWHQTADHPSYFLATGQADWGTDERRRTVKYTTGKFVR